MKTGKGLKFANPKHKDRFEKVNPETKSKIHQEMEKMKTANWALDFAEVVSDLNQELYDRFKETELGFSYCTNGYVDIIMFGEYMLWNSEMDDRAFDESANEYEPFEPYIKRLFNEWADRVYSLKFQDK